MNNELESIVKKVSYLTPSRYNSGRIVEYDLKAANISTLRNRNIISEEEYKRLSNLPKLEREKTIGLMIKKDPSIYTEIQKGIIDAKLLLVRNNNLIIPRNIMRVANDAIYINTGIDLQNIKFNDYIEFRQKSQFNCMMIIEKICVFVEFLQDGNLNVDIKGVGENCLALHQEYMTNIIVSVINFLERFGVEVAIDYLVNFTEQYLNLSLPIGYYREYNSECSYRIKQNIFSNYGATFVLSDLYEFNDKRMLDINFNYSIIREIYSILLSIYQRQRR